MKRFLVFSFSEYYPTGGLSDVSGDYDDLEEAIKATKDGSIYISSDECYIFDRIKGEIVFSQEPDI